LKYDYVIIGAGLAGITMANLLANKNKKVLVVEKRDHIGGNCYDEYMNGVLVHKYGPHIFHTNSKIVWNYLSQFTDWNDYKHKVKVSVDGKLITLPINLNSLNEICSPFKANYDYWLIDEIGKNKITFIYDLLSCKNVYLRSFGEWLYKNIYENYSLKQWGAIPDKSVLKRIPIRLNYNDNYFTDRYQGLPIDGYTKMFENMLFHKNIEVGLNSIYGDLHFIDKIYDNVIYTGKLDELFDYQYGKLPYRSLDFQFEIHDKLYYQKYGVINYPQHESMTRITEFKYLTKQACYNTVIAREYPKSCAENDTPYYPIINEENIVLYKKYKQLADKIPNLTLLGRLAEYKYYDMDDVVLKAIKESKKLC
jgi:UDP-galactopyranose mutase